MLRLRLKATSSLFCRQIVLVAQGVVARHETVYTACMRSGTFVLFQPHFLTDCRIQSLPFLSGRLPNFHDADQNTTELV